MRVLKNIIDDKTEGVLVGLLWHAQTWYHLFLELILEETLYFCPNIYLLTCSFRKAHPLARNLTLVAGKFSAQRRRVIMPTNDIKISDVIRLSHLTMYTNVIENSARKHDNNFWLFKTSKVNKS